MYKHVHLLNCGHPLLQSKTKIHFLKRCKKCSSVSVLSDRNVYGQVGNEGQLRKSQS